MRNQADFYSLFTALAVVSKTISCVDLAPAERLARFIAVLDDEEIREGNKEAREYFVAARSNSNDTGPRKLRTQILTKVLEG
jgi:hypothetical protein